MTKNILVALVGIISLIYLIDPGMGLFEIIPDSLPIIHLIASATLFLYELTIGKIIGEKKFNCWVSDWNAECQQPVSCP